MADAKPDYILVVIYPFGDYARGVQIKDAAEISKVLASENAHHVNKVTA